MSEQSIVRNQIKLLHSIEGTEEIRISSERAAQNQLNDQSNAAKEDRSSRISSANRDIDIVGQIYRSGRLALVMVSATDFWPGDIDKIDPIQPSAYRNIPPDQQLGRLRKESAEASKLVDQTSRYLHDFRSEQQTTRVIIIAVATLVALVVAYGAYQIWIS